MWWTIHPNPPRWLELCDFESFCAAHVLIGLKFWIGWITQSNYSGLRCWFWLTWSKPDWWKCLGILEEWRLPQPGRYLWLNVPQMQKETKHPDARRLAPITSKRNTMQVQNKMAKSSSGEMQGWHKWDVGAEILTRSSPRPPEGGSSIWEQRIMQNRRKPKTTRHLLAFIRLRP